MFSFDTILVGLGILGLLLTAVAVRGGRSVQETLPIGAGSLGLALVGLDGLIGQGWLLWLGAALVVVSIGADLYWRRRTR